MINIDHLDAIDKLETAYELISEFWEFIESNEGDYPMKDAVIEWLAGYELMEVNDNVVRY
jgi:hypothetical protein